MDGYQFTAEIFRSIVSLAWPAAFIAAVWLFRQRLTALLPLLRLKYKDFDVSFRLDQAEREAKALPVPEQPSEPTPEEADKFEKLVKVSPRAAILERRLELQDSVEAYAKSVRMDLPRQASLLQLTRNLRKHDLIDQTTSALLDDLRVIGNSAAHDATIIVSEEDAQRFGTLADRLIQQFRISAGAAAAIFPERSATISSGSQTEPFDSSAPRE